MEKMEASLTEMGGEGVVCGSRAHLEKDSIADRSLFRTILMLGFHMVVYLFGVKSVRDTQCGFKLFSRRVARLCFRYKTILKLCPKLSLNLLSLQFATYSALGFRR